MSTTYTLDTSTSRANPTPAPMKRLTVPAIQRRKQAGVTEQPVVMLTAYTARMAQLLDPHCDMLLVGSYHSIVVIDMPFGSYEASPEMAFASAARLLKETGAAAVKLEGGAAMAPTVKFLTERGIPVVGHVGLTPQAINILGSYAARGRSDSEADKIVADAQALDEAGAFAIVVEGVVEPIAIAVTEAVSAVVIGIGASARCDGQVLVTEDMLGLFERTARFVKRYENLAEVIETAVKSYAREVSNRSFPSADQTYAPKD